MKMSKKIIHPTEIKKGDIFVFKTAPQLYFADTKIDRPDYYYARRDADRYHGKKNNYTFITTDIYFKDGKTLIRDQFHSYDLKSEEEEPPETPTVYFETMGAEVIEDEDLKAKLYLLIADKYGVDVEYKCSSGWSDEEIDSTVERIKYFFGN
jgi:hypothetical protein